MTEQKKVAFYTLGCKLNFSETSTIARSFEQEGYAKVAFESAADIYVINTCSVTEQADKKCRWIVRKALSQNPYAFICVIGCYAQLKPKEIASIEGVDLVLGANEKFNILDHLHTIDKKNFGEFIAGKVKEVNEFYPAYSQGDRTRSFFKVQDGCDYFCSFCTIPLARGKSRSATIAKTIEQAQELAKTEVKEVVLTGVNIGDFGIANNENFYQLIQALEQVEGIPRYRISSIEPNLLTNQIIEFVAQSKKFAPHFHVPLQSGSDSILTQMRRKYLSSLYAERVFKIKELMPNACIGVDVIVGFPGESEEDFITTYNFINELPVSYLHVFTYSERNNTTAKKMQEIVPKETRNERSKMLRILSEKKKRAFYQSRINTMATVLFEAENDDNYMYGFTENYVKVKIPFDVRLVNQFVDVQLTEIDRDGIMKINVLQEITA